MATLDTLGGGASLERSAARDRQGGNRRYVWTGAAIGIFVLIGVVVVLSVQKPGTDPMALMLNTLVSAVLAALPLMIAYAQVTSRERQIIKLDSIGDLPVAQSQYYRIAANTVATSRPAVLDRHYTVPMLVFAFVVCLCWAFALYAPGHAELFARRHYLLGGLAVVGLPMQEGLDPSGNDIVKYQMGTFAVGVMALVGAYVYTLGRLLGRVNNNDIYPISFYYYAVRIIVACLVAVVVRHVLRIFVFGDQVVGFDTEIAMLIGFAIGFAPDLFIRAMTRRAFQFFKVTGDQRDPDADTVPTNFDLLMIDGIGREQSDRLTELGIDNAQVLSCQNPFMIWPRLPYDLALIVDWIAQAQTDLVKEKGLKALRDRGVNTIFDLRTALGDEAAHNDVAAALVIPPTSIPALTGALDINPCFSRLSDLRKRMVA